ncbi:alpha/beta hydrolase [Sciscionella sediminilitoris]|uniref:alpha/beta hydrolase n=1 Tax=Sciscionella sediminilitoris TaxID=1445613 RepID=UPI0004DEE91C|nr:alpha/beta hydrolase [Sciscionella sp. SE31]
MPDREDHRIGTPSGALAAWCYRPRGRGSGHCVVMANGLALCREHGLPRFAEAFAAAGHTVLLFDFGCLGASEGIPRQLVDPLRQRADYARVLAHAAGLPGVRRLVAWGYSYSGRHVLELAARRGDLAAVLATAPMASMLATTRGQPPVNLLRLAVAGMRDAYRSPVTVPAVAEHGVAVVRSPGALAGFRALTEGASWRNELAARFTVRSWPLLFPVRTNRITAPVFLAAAERDTIAPAAAVRRLAARIPGSRVRGYPDDHFAVLQRADLLADQLEFLDAATRAPDR